MSSFTDPLVLEALDEVYEGRGMFVTYAPFSYDVGFKGSGETITVPAGFRTDLCSVPAILRPFIPLAGRNAKPALLHDWLLSQKDPRCHAVFNEALKVNGVGDFTRCLLVNAVKLYARLYL